jgi:hypothetical protein
MIKAYWIGVMYGRQQVIEIVNEHLKKVDGILIKGT